MQSGSAALRSCHIQALQNSDRLLPACRQQPLTLTAAEVCAPCVTRHLLASSRASKSRLLWLVGMYACHHVDIRQCRVLHLINVNICRGWCSTVRLRHTCAQPCHVAASCSLMQQDPSVCSSAPVVVSRQTYDVCLCRHTHHNTRAPTGTLLKARGSTRHAHICWPSAKNTPTSTYYTQENVSKLMLYARPPSQRVTVTY